MAVEIGDYLLVPWHEFELLRGVEEVGALLERSGTSSAEDFERHLPELGHGQVVAVRRAWPRFGALASHKERATPLRELVSPPVPTHSVPVRPPDPLTPAPVPTPWLDVTIVTDDGAPIPGVELEVSDDWGFSARITTDSEGHARTDTPVDWLHHVRLCHVVELPESLAEPVELVGTVLARDAAEPIRLSANTEHVLVVPRPRAIVTSVDGWAEARAVLVFGTMREELRGHVTVRGALRSVLTAGHRGVIEVVGHADTKGQGADNDSLALERARSVHLYLAGRRADWAAHAFSRADVATLQAALEWVASVSKLRCSPGPIDNDWGPATEAALMAVRDHAGIGRPLQLGVHDWEAIYDIYDANLAELMLTDAAGLTAARAALQLAEPVAMGERWPVDAPELDDHECPANRRVDIVACYAGHTPQPETDELYDDTFVLEHRATPPEFVVQLLLVDTRFTPLPDGRALVDVGPLRGRELFANPAGIVELTALWGEAVRVRAANDRAGAGQLLRGGLPETLGVG